MAMRFSWAVGCGGSGIRLTASATINENRQAPTQNKLRYWRAWCQAHRKTPRSVTDRSPSGKIPAAGAGEVRRRGACAVRSPRQVVLAYLRALDAHDRATAYAV